MANTLALNGGNKAVVVPVPHYTWPQITDKTRNAVLSQIDESISIYDRSGIIKVLEDRLANYHGKKHALLTNSGTSALHSMYVGANLKEDDEVICPAYTFYATVTPLFFTGAVPILADCNEDGNISPAEIERRITPLTKAVVVTHMWGVPCDMDAITTLAKKHNLMVFEDASHAHGAIYKGRKAGTFGDASSFSMQAQKTLAAGEGGFLLTDNDDIFNRALMLGHYNKRCKKEIPADNPLYAFGATGMGLKLRIHPVAAAIANEQFDSLEQVLSGRRQIARIMSEELSSLPGIRVPEPSVDKSNSWYAFVMQYDGEQLGGLPIDKFHKALVAEGCLELDRPGSTAPLNTHPLFQKPWELFPGYSGKFSYMPGDFPCAEKFCKQALKLPVWHKPEDEPLVRQYINAFRKVVDNHKELL
ncbi:MAG: DegT/DnrJ/EryC1/StrS family aminotransferase [Candidatus Woesearchaeota archaeon]